MPKFDDIVASFSDINLPAPLLKALDDVGYESPTPIQAQTIPPLLEGRDLLGHAPTGTGKTAAFALPLLSRLDLKKNHVQVLVMTPTRELAIQVSEAFQRYASHLKGFHVLPIYGGQDYTGQIRQLRRGVHVVVGTPGRIMDHMRKGTLKLETLQALVLDEADEMLRMGFIDDIRWILEQTPADRQLALFSATMPREIQKIARQHLNKPHEVTIKSKTATAETIKQRYWIVNGPHKLDALTRILEAEPFDAILIFVRTRIATTELAEKLEARGHSAAALNGDMPQKQRERIVEKLKNGALEILVATDVAARGLDVQRISHVINYDIPYDTEAYIHRIGRTGRAGRTGEAILFVAPREKRMLHAIEKATRSKIELLTLPSTELVNNRRIAAFHQSINDTIATGRHEFMRNLLQQYQQEHEIAAIDVAAALASMYMGDKPFLLKPDKKQTRSEKSTRESSSRSKGAERLSKAEAARRKKAEASNDGSSKRASRQDFEDRTDKRVKRLSPTKTSGKKQPESRDNHVTRISASAADGKKVKEVSNEKPAATDTNGEFTPSKGMEWFRIEAGKNHDVKPATIIVTIANEAGLDAEYIGRMKIEDQHTFIELPEGMPKVIFQDLRKASICGERMRISKLHSNVPKKPGKGKSRKKMSEKSMAVKKKKRTDKTRKRARSGENSAG